MPTICAHAAFFLAAVTNFLDLVAVAPICLPTTRTRVGSKQEKGKRMRYKLPTSVARDVIQRFDADAAITVGEIARDLQVARSWAARVLRDAGRDPDARWRALTPERLAAAGARVTAGETLVDVAEEIGVHPATLSRGLRAAGRPPQDCPPPMDENEAAAVRDLYATGRYRKAALGRLFGRGHSAIGTALEGGPKARKPNWRHFTDQQKREMTRLYLAGVPIARICQQLGVGETSVYRHVRQTGLEQRQVRDVR